METSRYELSGYERSGRKSQETDFFKARIIDSESGEAVAVVENEGRGGCHKYSPADYEADGAWDALRAFGAYAETYETAIKPGGFELDDKHVSRLISHLQAGNEDGTAFFADEPGYDYIYDGYLVLPGGSLKDVLALEEFAGRAIFAYDREAKVFAKAR